MGSCVTSTPDSKGASMHYGKALWILRFHILDGFPQKACAFKYWRDYVNKAKGSWGVYLGFPGIMYNQISPIQGGKREFLYYGIFVHINKLKTGIWTKENENSYWGSNLTGI